MDMDMADHTTGIGGLIIVDIVRLTIVRPTVRVSTGDGAAGRRRLRDLLKMQAKLAGLEIRKRPDGAEIVGPYVVVSL
jgi:hypothetical protein